MRVVSLPLINGGVTLHMTNPYFPIPFSNGLVQGTPDVGYPQLVPRFTLDDGSQLIATSFLRSIKTEEHGDGLTLMYHQDELNRLGETGTIKDDRLGVKTTYTFDSGVMTRTDVYTPSAPLKNVKIDMEFASFGENVARTDKGFAFAVGDALTFDVEGFTRLSSESVAGSETYRTPMGQMKTVIRCERDEASLSTPITLRWQIRYRPQ